MSQLWHFYFLHLRLESLEITDLGNEAVVSQMQEWTGEKALGKGPEAFVDSALCSFVFWVYFMNNITT